MYFSIQPRNYADICPKLCYRLTVMQEPTLSTTLTVVREPSIDLSQIWEPHPHKDLDLGTQIVDPQDARTFPALWGH